MFHTVGMLRRLIRQGSHSHAVPALLACVLLFAQAVVLVHDLDRGAWDSGHACEICLSASVLGAGDVAATPETPVIPALQAPEPVPAQALTSFNLPQAHARDPPTAS